MQPAGKMCFYFLEEYPKLIGCRNTESKEPLQLVGDAESFKDLSGPRVMLFDFTPVEANDSYFYRVTIRLNFQPFDPSEEEDTLSANDILEMPVDPQKSKEAFCVVTLLYGESYLPGVLALHESFLQSGMSHLDFIVITLVSDRNGTGKTPSLTEKTVQLLEGRGIKILAVFPLDFSPGTMLGEELGTEIWLKLRLWEALTNYSSALYLDADALILQNLEEIFRLEKFAGVSAYIPGGCFYFVPSEDIFQNMVQTLEENDKYLYADQDFLNHFFRGSKYVLAKEYHCWADNLGHTETLGGCKVVEFASCGDIRWKPWMGKEALPDGERFCINFPSDEFWEVSEVWDRMFQRALQRSSVEDLMELW
mmetsp:Transcript_33045/g.42220  ORF Transcript_33045/g.42220 Transcript_33045/m.42220 type:complete len:365 (+) Transcript_33045:77-1171(+)